jgi:hypothetical protein
MRRRQRLAASLAFYGAAAVGFLIFGFDQQPGPPKAQRPSRQHPAREITLAPSNGHGLRVTVDCKYRGGRGRWQPCPVDPNDSARQYVLKWVRAQGGSTIGGSVPPP